MGPQPRSPAAFFCGTRHAEAPIQSLPDSTKIEAVVEIVARARRHSALQPLGSDEAAALRDATLGVVRIARAGRGVSVPPKWERERIAWQLVGLLRQGHTHVLVSSESELTDFDLALLDIGLLNAARERGWMADPERGAREIEDAINRHRRAAYYGQIIRDDGTQAANRSGRKTDHARLSVIIDAMGIFESFADSKVKSSPQSAGARFVAAVLEMSGYPASGLPQAIARAIALTTLSDLDLECRQDEA